jgi:hypothetical protein
MLSMIDRGILTDGDVSAVMGADQQLRLREWPGCGSGPKNSD